MFSHPHSKKVFKENLLRAAAVCVAIDAIFVLCFHVFHLLDPAFAEHVESFLNVSNSFGSTCGAVACLIREQADFLDK